MEQRTEGERRGVRIKSSREEEEVGRHMEGGRGVKEGGKLDNRGRKRRGREEYLLAVPFTTISLSSPSENECRLGW